MLMLWPSKLCIFGRAVLVFASHISPAEVDLRGKHEKGAERTGVAADDAMLDALLGDGVVDVDDAVSVGRGRLDGKLEGVEDRPRVVGDRDGAVLESLRL